MREWLRNIILCNFIVIGSCHLISPPARAAADDEHQCLFSGTGDSVDSEDAKSCLDADDFLGLLDLAAPTNALFALMGSAPDTVVKPKPGDKIMLSLLPNVIDQFGGDEYGFAIEVNPSQFLLPKRFTLGELNGEPLRNEAFTNRQGELFEEHRSNLRKLKTAKFWYPFSISGAISKETGETDIFRAGVGVNYNFDPSGPLFKNTFGECVGRELRRTDPNFDEADVIGELQSRLEPELKAKGLTQPEVDAIVYKEFLDSSEFKKSFASNSQKIIKKCAKEASKWNRPIYGGGAAFYYSDVDAPAPETMMGPMVATPAGDETGFGVWLSHSRPNPISRKYGQVTVHARYTENLIREREVSGMKMTESVDGWSVGGRVTHQIYPLDDAKEGQIMRGFIEAAYTEEKFGTVDDDFVQAGIGLELQLRTDLFFQIIVGDTFGSEIDRDEYLSGQIKWSFSKLAGK